MAGIWRRLQLLAEGTTAARRYQEEADVGVAAVLTCFRGLNLDPRNEKRERGELFEEAVATIEKKNFAQQKQYVQDQVTSQGQLNEENSLRKLLGYSLSVEKSSVPDAGEGVKLHGHVPIGSVVTHVLYVLKALYPGIVYLPEHFKKSHYLKEVSDNPYARARFDSVIIDAKNASSTPRNLLAVAHKINHPPSGTPPNVLPFSFDFPPKEPFTLDEYQQLIPNSFVEMPSRLSMFGKRALVHGLAFIATADINDEEVFLNYRYNPNRPLPEWYTPVDIESDREMWK